jgi:hypothetical protein
MKTERLLAIALTALAACAAAPAKKTAVSYGDFACKERRASYILTGALSMYHKQGIRMTCEGDVPRVERFFELEDGTEKKHTGTVSPNVWNKSWQDFENAGWRNLHDCENKGAGDRDAIYDFEVADGEFQSLFQCQGSALPFPYDTIQQALESAAAELPSDPSAD